MREAGFNVRLLSAGPFVTMIDRFAVAPALIPIAIEFRAPVGAVAIAATAYYLAYGLAQPFWGFASDRAGRIRIIRISLAAASAACFPFGARAQPQFPDLCADRRRRVGVRRPPDRARLRRRHDSVQGSPCGDRGPAGRGRDRHRRRQPRWGDFSPTTSAGG